MLPSRRKMTCTCCQARCGCSITTITGNPLVNMLHQFSRARASTSMCTSSRLTTRLTNREIHPPEASESDGAASPSPRATFTRARPPPPRASTSALLDGCAAMRMGQSSSSRAATSSDSDSPCARAATTLQWIVAIASSVPHRAAASRCSRTQSNQSVSDVEVVKVVRDTCS